MIFLKKPVYIGHTQIHLFFTSSAAAAKKLFPDLCWDSWWLSRVNKRNKHQHIVCHIKFHSW